MKLDTLNKIYFIGIGGIGMSAVARYFKGRGMEVYGYDRVETGLTRQLSEEGIVIHYEEDINQIPKGIDLVVYTPAISKEHQELQHFLKQDFLVIKRSEALGLISKDQKAIGIAGTHGKTTTSCILTHLLRTGGIDCSAFLGGISKNLGSNFVQGKSPWVVIEADEFDRSFLRLHPTIAAITSMDADHLDIYGSHDNMLDSFREYIGQVKEKLYYAEGLPVDGEKYPKLDIETYGVEMGAVFAENIRAEAPYFIFDFVRKGLTIRDLKFSLPGHHNVSNACVSIAIALDLGVEPKAIREGLLSFKGIQRRFELIYRDEGCTYIDDYAHHPSELNAAIHAIQTLYPNKKIIGIFQPHLYSRTQDFFEGFAEALDRLDEIILLDIYPARELPIEGVSTGLIFDKMKNKNKQWIKKSKLLENLVNCQADVVLTLGAGDIGAMVQDIASLLKKSKKKEFSK